MDNPLSTGWYILVFLPLVHWRLIDPVDTALQYFELHVLPQSPEEMCLSLEHQTCQKPLKKWVIFYRVTVSLHTLTN